MICFACFSPHPPILLPSVGSEEDRKKVEKTIISLEFLGNKFKEAEPDCIIISSPHPDWGFNVPLFFLARHSLGEGGLVKDFEGEIKTELTSSESPAFYFEKGKEIYTKYKIQDTKYKVALIASGDLSHCLKEDGPYGFNPDGPKFDKALIEYLKKKDIKNILKLDEMFPNAGECGLRSFCFVLGILEASGIHPVKSRLSGISQDAKLFNRVNWQPKILSYEGPFGVGYLVVNFKL